MDSRYPESPLAPENESYADIASEAYLDALKNTPWSVIQRRNEDDAVESVIARFQHKNLAERFLASVQAVQGCYLSLEGGND